MMARKWTCIKLAFKLSSEEFSCQRVQSQTCLSYAECSRKSHVCKMYKIVNIQMKYKMSNYEYRFDNTMSLMVDDEPGIKFIDS